MSPNRINLNSAVANLYSTFVLYPLRPHVGGCPCCVSNTEQLALQSLPLRQLGSEHLSRYAFKAMTTWGDENDFKHFLPRIFELMFMNRGIGSDEEAILAKLTLAKWKAWPENEQAAVRQYFMAGWKFLLASESGPIQTDSWLCGIGRSGENLESYLTVWIECRFSSGYQHLAGFAESGLTNSFWSDALPALNQVAEWLKHPTTAKRLETIYLENPESAFAAALSKAVEKLPTNNG